MKKISVWQMMFVLWLLVTATLTGGEARAQYTLKLLPVAYSDAGAYSGASQYGRTFTYDGRWDGYSPYPSSTGQGTPYSDWGVGVSQYILSFINVQGVQNFNYISTLDPVWQITGTPNTQVDVTYEHSSTIENESGALGNGVCQFSATTFGGAAVSVNEDSGFNPFNNRTTIRHLVVPIDSSGKATFSIAVGVNLTIHLEARGGSSSVAIVVEDHVDILSLNRIH